jgi:hypothetical protein
MVLFILAILLTSLGSTDIFPHDFRREVIRPLVLKAFPCILIWLKIILDMMLKKNGTPAPISINSIHSDPA